MDSPFHTEITCASKAAIAGITSPSCILLSTNHPTIPSHMAHSVVLPVLIQYMHATGRWSSALERLGAGSAADGVSNFPLTSIPYFSSKVSA